MVECNRKKAYRTIAKLTSSLETERRLKDKYKHRWLRLVCETQESEGDDVEPLSPDILSENQLAVTSQSERSTSQPLCTSTPRSKTRALMRTVKYATHAVKKTILYHNVMV